MCHHSTGQWLFKLVEQVPGARRGNHCRNLARSMHIKFLDLKNAALVSCGNYCIAFWWTWMWEQSMYNGNSLGEASKIVSVKKKFISTDFQCVLITNYGLLGEKKGIAALFNAQLSLAWNIDKIISLSWKKNSTTTFQLRKERSFREGDGRHLASRCCWYYSPQISTSTVRASQLGLTSLVGNPKTRGLHHNETHCNECMRG